MKHSALIIGCGNIGALYDLDDPSKVWTHAKAFSKTPRIDFSVADVDNKLAKKIGKRYNVEVVDLGEETDFRRYDIVSITTPTPTHFDYLKNLLKQKIPVIICEKPVAANTRELNTLVSLYKKSGSKVLVNYMRRFQPSYIQLKKILINELSLLSCRGINVKYQRGLLNNGSHAFDLLEFLFDQPFSFDRFKVQSAVFDSFEYDPTVSGSSSFAGCPVSILGIEKAIYPIFEIELFFSKTKIVICHSGDEIRFYEYNKNEKLFLENTKLPWVNILSGYMLPVINKAVQLFKEKDEPDNFLEAITLNKKITQIISTLRKNDRENAKKISH